MNYTVGTKIDDALLTSGNAQDRIMDIISSMVEFVSFRPLFLKRALLETCPFNIALSGRTSANPGSRFAG